MAFQELCHGPGCPVRELGPGRLPSWILGTGHPSWKEGFLYHVRILKDGTFSVF